MFVLYSYDIAFNKCENDQIREKILYIKDKHRELLEEDKIQNSKILENRIRRGEKIQKMSNSLKEEIDETEKESASYMKSIQDSCSKLSYQTILYSKACSLKSDLTFEKSIVSHLHREDRIHKRRVISLKQNLITLMIECISDESLTNKLKETQVGINGIAHYIVLQRSVDDFDIYVNGKAIGQTIGQLDQLCDGLRIKPVSAFVQGDQYDTETWYAPDDGLGTFNTLLTFLQENPRKVKGSKNIEKDLIEYREVLEYAKKTNNWFRIQIDA